MRILLSTALLLFLFAGCKKDGGEEVAIYLLKTFTRTINPATNPVTVVLTNPVLSDAPLITNQDIAWYKKETATFKLKKDIRPLMRNLGADKGFAVTVNGQPVYYGVFHPLYMSSLVFGLATIDPLMTVNNELPIHYIHLDGDPALKALDKRNDPRLLNALKATRRLR